MNLSEVKIIAKYFLPGDSLYRKTIYVDGKLCVCCVDAENYFHQEINRPAVVSLDEKYFVFWNNQNLHRTDGPAIIEPWGSDKLKLCWFYRGNCIKNQFMAMRPIPADLFKNYH